MLYFKDNRQLHLLSNADYVKICKNIYENDEKTEIGFRIIDIINKTTAENNPNNELFRLLVTVLDVLDGATKNYINVLFYLECKLAILLGFGIDTSGLVNKNEIKTNLYESYLTKSYAKGKSGEKLLQPDTGTIKRIIEFTKLKENDILNIKLERQEQKYLDSYFTDYFKTHIEDLELI